MKKGNRPPGAKGNAKQIEPEPSDSVRAQEIAIREHVNGAKLRSRLLKNQKAWNEIVSSLDAIGDTEMALQACELGSDAEPGTGTQYLLAYGTLQALFIQQDAVIHLSQALGGPSQTDILGDTRLSSAREIRNLAVGHPTRKDLPRSKPSATSQISRQSLEQHGFDLWTSDERGEHRMERVDLVGLIREQRSAVTDVLSTINKKLDDDDQKARKSVRDDPMVAVFPDILGYAFEKLWEATQGDPNRAVLGPWALDTVTEVLAAFLKALERRGLDRSSYPGIDGWFSGIDHPILELRRFFDPSQPRDLHPKTAAILAEHVRHKLKKLRRMAEEVDEEWTLPASGPGDSA